MWPVRTFSIRSSWLASLVVALTIATARADETTGAIVITVTQAPDDNAVVEITGVNGTQGWSGRVDGTTPAAIRGLPPGTYRVEVLVASGARAAETVDVGQAEIVSMRAERASGQTPVWTMQVVDRRRSAEGTYADAREMRALPEGSGISAWLDTMVPFLIADGIDAGGAQLGRNVRVGSRGASAVDETIALGEFAAERAPGADHRLTVLVDPAAVETMSVTSGNASADVAGSGAAIVIVPRRPGQKRQGSVDASWTDPSMVSSNTQGPAPPITRLDSWKSGGVTFGAPLNRKVAVLASASFADSRAYEPGLAIASNASVGSAFLHGIRRLDDRTQLRLIVSFQAASRPYGDVAAFRTASVDEHDRLFQSQASWDRNLDSGARLEVAGGFQRGTFSPTGPYPSGAAVDRALEGLIPLPAGDTEVDRTETRVTFAPPSRARHAIEVGASVARSQSSFRQSDESPRAELVDGMPARVWIPIAPSSSSDRAATHLAAYLMDRVAAADRLTFDLGLRLGRSTGHATGGDPIAWNALLPRASFRWVTPLATFSGGYGRYQAELPLDLLAFGDPGEPVMNVYRWSDANANGRFDAGEAGPLVALAGHGRAVASIDSALRAPYTDEVTIAAERRFGSHLVIKAAQVHRTERSLVRSVNVGAPPESSYALRLIPDRDSPSRPDRLLAVYDRLPSSFGADRYVLTNSPGETARYDGTEISWEWRTCRWWSSGMALSYDSLGQSASRGPRADENDQGLPGEVFETPNANSYPHGHLFYDRSYVLKFDVGYQAPKGITIAAVARYQDGQPFSRLVVVPDLAQGADLVNAEEPGRVRFTFTSTLDARIEKAFDVRGHRTAVRLEIFNLPNLGYEIEENPVSGPAFRSTIAVQPPRALRVGVHVEF
jgi:hypothetical protein